jgi:hypothetical protein
MAEPGAYLGATARGGEEAGFRREPVTAWRRLLAGDDFHHVAIAERLTQGHDPAVELGAAAAVT